MLTNIESEFLVSPFWNHHKSSFETTYSFNGLKQMVRSAGKKFGPKISGVLCQAIWDLTESPAIFSQSRRKFNTCVDINLEIRSSMKKQPCTWMESALIRRKDRDKHHQSRLKSTNHSELKKKEWSLRFNFFKKWRKSFPVKTINVLWITQHQNS